MKSILQEERHCYLCYTTRNLQCHHVFNSVAMRPKSETYGAKIWLCKKCHDYIHADANARKALKAEAQKRLMEYNNWSLDDWFEIFCDKNYL